MKKILFLITLLIFALCKPALANDSWKNYFGISWRGTAADNIKYAKQMGYDYLAIKINEPANSYTGNQNCANLKYYIIDPHAWTDVLSGHLRAIDKNGTYTQSEKNWYEQRMAWKTNTAWPNNLATGYFNSGTSSSFNSVWDFQQQAVIDEVVEKEITLFHNYEDAGLPFTFAGHITDVTVFTGELFNWPVGSSSQSQYTMAQWTGTDSCILHGTITHEYTSYTEGMVAYYKQLNTRMQQDFPAAKWIVDPARIYDPQNTIFDWHVDEYVYQIKDRADKNQLTPAMLTQEDAGDALETGFVDNASIFNSGVNITKSMVGISQSSIVDEYKNRLYAAKAGINGAWYNWFGRFGGANTMPDFSAVTAVYPRLKLIRCIPNWDNLNNIGTSSRSWDGTTGVYVATVGNGTWSFMGSWTMYSRNWKRPTEMVICVQGTSSAQLGTVTVRSGESVSKIWLCDEFGSRSTEASSDWIRSGQQIYYPTVNMLVGSQTDTGKMYIFDILPTACGMSGGGSIQMSGGGSITVQ